MRGIAGIFDGSLIDLLREAEHEGNRRGRAVKETGLLRALVVEQLSEAQHQRFFVWPLLNVEEYLSEVL